MGGKELTHYRNRPKKKKKCKSHVLTLSEASGTQDKTRENNICGDICIKERINSYLTSGYPPICRICIYNIYNLSVSIQYTHTYNIYLFLTTDTQFLLLSCVLLDLCIIQVPYLFGNISPNLIS